MTSSVSYTIDGRKGEAAPNETIWDVSRLVGSDIPILCHSPSFGYRPDGNCRVCMVEIQGERVLSSSCNRRPEPNMVVVTDSQRAESARSMVLELLMADQPVSASASIPESQIQKLANQRGQVQSRFPEGGKVAADNTHPAISVNLQACIHCTQCVRLVARFRETMLLAWLIEVPRISLCSIWMISWGILVVWAVGNVFKPVQRMLY